MLMTKFVIYRMAAASHFALIYVKSFIYLQADVQKTVVNTKSE